MRRYWLSPALKNATILSVGLGTSQVIALLSFPLITRLYSPTDFGLFSYLLSIAGVSAVVILMCLDSAIIITKPLKHKIWLIEVVLCLLAAVCFLALSVIIIDDLTFQVNPLSIVSGLLTLFMLGGIVIEKLSMSYLHSLDQYKYMALANVLKQTVFLIAAVSFVWLTDSFIVLCIALAVSTTPAVIMVVKYFRFSFIKIKRQVVNAILTKHQKFIKFQLPTTLINIAGKEMPLWFLGLLSSLETAGIYALSYRVLFAPASVFSTAISNVMIRKLAAKKEGGAQHNDAVTYLMKAVGMIILVITPLFALTVLLLHNGFFAFLLGEEWVAVDATALSLLPWVFMTIVCSPLSPIPVVYAWQDIALVFGTIYFVVRVLIMLLLFYFSSTVVLWCFSIFSAVFIAIASCYFVLNLRRTCA